MIAVHNGVPYERCWEASTIIDIHVIDVLPRLHLRACEHGLEILHLLNTQAIMLTVG